MLSIGRGNAKTALASGLALAHLSERSQTSPSAKSSSQHAIAIRRVRRSGFWSGFIEGLPEDEQEQFTIRRGSRLEVETDIEGGGLARVIPADGRSILGGAPTLAILDERAAWEREKGDNLENAILSGLGKRDGKALIISTSAPDDTNTFSRWMDEPPPGTYVQEHRPSRDCPLTIWKPADRQPRRAAGHWQHPGMATGAGQAGHCARRICAVELPQSQPQRARGHR